MEDDRGSDVGVCDGVGLDELAEGVEVEFLEEDGA